MAKRARRVKADDPPDYTHIMYDEGRKTWFRGNVLLEWQHDPDKPSAIKLDRPGYKGRVYHMETVPYGTRGFYTADHVHAIETLPKRVRYDGRICFSISFFRTEEDAKLYAGYVVATDRRYNGGMYHGMLCGRETRFDHKDELGPLYAVTH